VVDAPVERSEGQLAGDLWAGAHAAVPPSIGHEAGPAVDVPQRGVIVGKVQALHAPLDGTLNTSYVCPAYDRALTRWQEVARLPPSPSTEGPLGPSHKSHTVSEPATAKHGPMSPPGRARAIEDVGASMISASKFAKGLVVHEELTDDSKIR
jgi:hypothetical protein